MNSWLCNASLCFIFVCGALPAALNTTYSPQWRAYDLFLSYVSDYVTQTTLQTRRKYSLLDTRGSVSEKFFFLFLKVEERKASTLGALIIKLLLF